MKKCYICGSKQSIHLHHFGWHRTHNKLSNRVFLCARCRGEVHKIGYLSLEELNDIREKVKAREPERFTETLPNLFKYLG